MLHERDSPRGYCQKLELKRARRVAAAYVMLIGPSRTR